MLMSMPLNGQASIKVLQMPTPRHNEHFRVPIAHSSIIDSSFYSSKVVIWAKTYDEFAVEKYLVTLNKDSSAFLVVQRLDYTHIYPVYRNAQTVPLYHEKGEFCISYQPFAEEDIEIKISFSEENILKETIEEGLVTLTEYKTLDGYGQWLFRLRPTDQVAYWDLFDFIPEYDRDKLFKTPPTPFQEISPLPNLVIPPVRSSRGNSKSVWR